MQPKAFVIHFGTDIVMYPRDIFFVHASSDKLLYVRRLEAELSAYGVSIWVDDGQIRPGDSITNLVGLGLSKAATVVLLITETFLKRPWPEKELHAALALEIESRANRIIPVIDIPRATVVENYPLLADKRFLKWSAGPERIAKDLSELFQRRPAEWHVGIHPTDWTGPVWTRITPDRKHLGKDHELTILWRQVHYKTTLKMGSSTSLVHEKTIPDDLALYVRTLPEAIVTFGQGPPPDRPGVDINEGWKRLAGSPIV